MQKSCILLILILSPFVWAKKLSSKEQLGVFSGRVSRINEKVRMVRIRSEFENMRFLNKKDRVEFWLHPFHKSRCEGSIIGKTNSYLLLKIPNMSACRVSMKFTVGSYIRLYSKDLAGNISVAEDLIKILLKKRLAIDSMIKKTEAELEGYVEKVEAVNKRFQSLRAQLELEWQKSLTNLENDKSVILRNYNDLKIRMGEVDHKLEQYKVEDSNLKYDRWSLDPRLFTRK